MRSEADVRTIIEYTEFFKRECDSKGERLNAAVAKAMLDVLRWVVEIPAPMDYAYAEVIRRCGDGSSITCPRCGKTSFSPTDVAEGYCGNCHDWTGK